MTIVSINTFKDSGKWYDNFRYESEIPCWDTDNLIKEAIEKHKISMDFTIKADNGQGAVNFRLHKINKL